MNAESIIVTPKAAIVCDDIRTELSRKEILVGVYPSDIIVNQVPARIRLRIYLIVEVNKKGAAEFEINAEGPDPENKISIEAGFEVTKDVEIGEYVSFAFPPFILSVPSDGFLKIYFRIKGAEERELLRTMPIIFREIQA